MKRKTQLLSVLLLATLLLAGLAPAQALDKQTRLDVMSDVVQMSLVKIQGGQVYYLPWGSGTIISSDGLILTNCHVADPIRYGLPADQVPEYDYLGVGLTVKSDRPPQLSYLAEVVQADPVLDLAVVRITKKTDQKPIKAQDLNLPYVEVGDSDAIEVGDDLNIFGYPGIGGDTVTFTRGVVSGFTQDASVAGRAWIKTDASISGGNSGGTAVDEAGQLIGVPTRAGAGDEWATVDCRPVKDTNGDGRIDNNDDCVPVGGFINALRPVNLAKPLIDAARAGLSDPGRDRPVADDPLPQGSVRLSGLFFSTGVNEFNQPLTVVNSLPTGSRSLYLFFDYENMDSSRSLEMKVLIGGQERPEWGLPAGPWGGEAQGAWWIGWGDVELGDGTYDMVLYVDGREQARAKIQVGGRAQAQPAFSNLLLSLQATAQGGAKEPGVLFPAGTKELSGFFDYANMSRGTKWSQTWLLDGQVIGTKEDTWQEGTSGSTSVTLTSARGLQAGAYRLSLSIAGKLAAQSNFWVTGGQGQGASFGPLSFAEGIDSRGNPVGAAQKFASGLEELHTFSEYSGMEDGMDFAVTWYLDGDQIYSDPYAWDGGSSGDWHYYLFSNSGALPDGQYDVELQIAGQTLQTGNTTLGSGAQPPQPTPTPATGVQLEGTIVDLDTGRPIDSAVFIVLQPGVTVSSFQWTDAEVYTSTQADRQGVFKLPDLLQRGECYSMIIGAEGYWAYGEDDVCIGQDTDDVMDLTVQLEKK